MTACGSEEPEISTYTIRFSKNHFEVNGTMSDQTFKSGESKNLIKNSYTLDGYIFIGWALTPSGSVEYKDEAEFTMGDADLTLFAKWAK